MTRRQMNTKFKIEQMSAIFGVDPKWTVAVAMTESSLGERQVSPTGCRGVFQMSQIAMKDLWIKMAESDDDDIDIACGVAYLRLLLQRHKTIDAATERFCNPMDRDLYLSMVKGYMDALST